MLRPLTARQKDWLDRAVALRECHLAPNARSVDESGLFPQHNIDALRESGLFGIGVPEELGGAGADMLGVAMVFEEMARGCGSTAMIFSMNVCAWWTWSKLASKEQQERYIVPGVRQRLLATFANTERAAGTHLWNWFSSARKVDGGWVLNAEKAFVTGGAHADVYWFTTRPSEDVPSNAGSLFYVDGKKGGIEVSDPWRGMGLRAQNSSRMTFKDIFVPDDAGFCTDGSLLAQGMKHVSEAVCTTVPACFLGMAQCMLDETVKHARTRVHLTTGQRLSQVDMIQERVGAMRVQVDAAREFFHSAVEFAESSSDPGASMIRMLQAKSLISRVCGEVAQSAMHVCGAAAYRGETEVGRAYRDSLAAPLMAPSEDWCNIRIGRISMGEPVNG